MTKRETSSAPSRDPLTLPREQWREHPNYPEQVLLMGSHENFRQVGRLLIEAAGSDGAEPLYGPTAIRRLFEGLIGAMRNHEHYEEAKLYPYLTHRYGADLTSLRAGHERLHVAADAVRAALERCRERAAAAAEDLRRTLREHQEVLVEHLREEEDVVIPMLLDLSRAEFVRYTTSPLSALVQAPAD